MKNKDNKYKYIFVAIIILIILIFIYFKFFYNKKKNENDDKSIEIPKKINIDFLKELKNVNSVQNLSSLRKIKFNTNIGEKEFYLQTICGDNQCFYRSFINGLSYLKYKKNLGHSADIQSLIDKLKELIIKFLQNTNDEDLRAKALIDGKSIQDYINESKSKSYWGGENEMEILSKKFEINIFAFTTSNRQILDLVNTIYPIQNSVYLYHTGGVHYSSLIPIV